ncbi:MAG: hypothetical protein RH947_12990 [Alcanivorax sp.]|tara:strand:- start:5588 stop:5917 length:330 start_codon:yes stop_codon:yes gene_type:complete
MEFFLPFAKDKEEATSVLAATAQFIGNPVPPPIEMIYTIHYMHNGIQMVATVGEDVDSYYKEAKPTVIAIFPPKHNGAPIKICLADRGVVRGEPIYVDGGSQYITFQDG